MSRMRPSDVSELATDNAAAEAEQICKRLTRELKRMQITDPDSVVVALSSMMIDAHIAAKNATPAGMVGAFALSIVQIGKPDLDVDMVPTVTASLLRFIADGMDPQS